MPLEKWSDEVVVVHLADDPQFTDDLESLETAVSQSPLDAVLEFGAVHFINSSNIAKLLKVRKQMVARGSRLLLCNIGTQVWGAFLITGLDKVFELSDNVPTALATLHGCPPRILPGRLQRRAVDLQSQNQQGRR
jgi:anti-anti-sigma factor